MNLQLDQSLERLRHAKAFAKSTYQTELFQIAETLLSAPSGLHLLYERAPLFDEVGVFDGGPWKDPSRLLPYLVAGGLKGQGVYPIVETLSELRMLAIAQGRAESSHINQEEAKAFLTETMALNLDFLLPRETEQERVEGGPFRESNIRLFALFAQELGLSSLGVEVLEEIEQICAQRPIVTSPVRGMIELAHRIPDDEMPDEVQARLEVFTKAIHGPSVLSSKGVSLGKYRSILLKATFEELLEEARGMAASMHQTGLVCDQHAVLLRHITRRQPELLSAVLGLGPAGEAELGVHHDFVCRMIRAALFPATAQSIYGFALMLERSLLSRMEVQAGLEKLVELDLHEQTRSTLLTHPSRVGGLSANALLVAGSFSVLGQPIGLGQGGNPTCQAARGISLWSQHAPGYLLEMIISAAREGHVHLDFEGTRLRSDISPMQQERMRDRKLDPVSLVLVPHLDKLYEALMSQIAGRSEDGHKWVNPALYGRWVPSGFASVFANVAQTIVGDYDGFVRRFYGIYHPSYNGGVPLMYANPVGLCITNSHGDYLGPHAVSLQRVAEAPNGELRAYFFNPNNEGRQNWGRGVCPSVSGNGEVPGESSLPFEQFVARLYAFHYNPYEEGDGFALADEVVSGIEAEARQTWGRAFTWSQL